VTIMAGYNRQPSSAHTHEFDPSPPVAESQQISAQLTPLVQELNAIIDRLEALAGLAEGEQDDAAEDP
jgi:hypothetical protein